jgi:hypothetical protein
MLGTHPQIQHNTRFEYVEWRGQSRGDSARNATTQRSLVRVQWFPTSPAREARLEHFIEGELNGRKWNLVANFIR